MIDAVLDEIKRHLTPGNKLTGPWRLARALTERFILSDRERGLYDKYKVTRADGDPESRHAGCKYFVLDVTHDPHALPALLTYADRCAKTHTELAVDLRLLVTRAVEDRWPSAMTIMREWLAHAGEGDPLVRHMIEALRDEIGL